MASGGADRHLIASIGDEVNRRSWLNDLNLLGRIELGYHYGDAACWNGAHFGEGKEEFSGRRFEQVVLHVNSGQT